MSRRPDEDVETALRLRARFSVSRKEKQFAPWIRIHQTTDLDDALALASDTTAFEVAVLLERESGECIYWTSRVPDLFNSTVLRAIDAPDKRMATNEESEFFRFLRTGTLCGLQLGVHQDGVRDVLGEPEEAQRSGKQASIWTYSSRFLQLYFRRTHLIGIGVYLNYRGAPRLPCVGGDVPFTTETTSEELVEQLTSTGISCREGGRLDAKYSVGDASISVTFDLDGKLDSFQHFTSE